MQIQFYGGLTFDKKRPYTFVTSVAKTEDLRNFVSIFKIESLLLRFYWVFLQAFFCIGITNSFFIYYIHIQSHGSFTFDKKRPYSFKVSVADIRWSADFCMNFQDSKLYCSGSIWCFFKQFFLYWNHLFLLYLLQTNEFLWKFNFW